MRKLIVAILRFYKWLCRRCCRPLAATIRLARTTCGRRWKSMARRAASGWGEAAAALPSFHAGGLDPVR